MILSLLFLLSFIFQPVRIKYKGGGDWYNDPEILPNITRELKERVNNIEVNPREKILTLKDPEIFNYPFLFITGHGNIVLSDDEIQNLRKYLRSGGFVYIDDDYGMDKFIRRELKRAFPDKKLEEIPFTHPIYHIFYNFPEGLPKIHEHYKGPPRAYGIFLGGRLSLLYTFNSNISDGWTDRYGDPQEIREKAVRFGINIILYSILY